MSAAEFAREPARQNDFQRARQRRQKPNRIQRFAENFAAEFCQPNTQRRVVGITESEMFRAREKIKLVAEIAVTVARDEKKKNFEKRERVSDEKEDAERFCQSVEERTRVGDPLAMREESFNILICRGLKEPFPEVWKRIKHWN